MRAPPALYHYTCTHVAPQIGLRGMLRPNANPMFPELRPLVWLTDMPTPSADALGLTSHTLSCDRTRVRYRVLDDARRAVPWLMWSRCMPEARHAIRVLESIEGSRPGTWWIAVAPVDAERA